MIIAKPLRKHIYTPLRYPGGKTSLFRFFERVIQENELEKVTYIEPYAGGVGAGLALLILDKVDQIVINDFDVAVYGFWHSILNEPERFISKIEETPLTINEWEQQKTIYKQKNKDDLFGLGFSLFYLNRTNRSGILNAGPVGGKSQNGKWKMDARFNKESLIERIRLIANYRDKITVLNMDGVDVIKKYHKNKRALFYIDPPYYVKGGRLYLNSFKIRDHEKLANLLNQIVDSRWIVTYDNVKEIQELYKYRRQDTYILGYSAHHASPSGSEVVIFSDSLMIPELNQEV